MLACMEKRRVTFDVPEVARRAISMFAAQEDITFGDALLVLARGQIPDFVEKAERAISGDQPPEPKKKGGSKS